MRKFKKAQRLPHDWAMLKVALHKYQRSPANPEKSDHGQEALNQLTQLLDSFSDEMMDAIQIVSQADGDVNASRSQQITQYHHNRIGKLQNTIGAIDEQIDNPPVAGTLDPLTEAELASERKNLVYQLNDHSNKVDKRSHGLHLSRMRRKHR